MLVPVMCELVVDWSLMLLPLYLLASQWSLLMRQPGVLLSIAAPLVDTAARLAPHFHQDILTSAEVKI